MALITISNLNADLSASDSFLTELQATDSSQIFGGSSHGGGYEKEGKGKGKEKENEGHEGKGKGYGYPCPPVYCPPVYNPCH
jgi:hypothetical protein